MDKPPGCIVCSEARRGTHRGNISVVSPASAKGQMRESREGQGWWGQQDACCCVEEQGSVGHPSSGTAAMAW